MTTVGTPSALCGCVPVALLNSILGLGDSDASSPLKEGPAEAQGCRHVDRGHIRSRGQCHF